MFTFASLKLKGYPVRKRRAVRGVMAAAQHSPPLRKVYQPTVSQVGSYAVWFSLSFPLCFRCREFCDRVVAITFCSILQATSALPSGVPTLSPPLAAPAQAGG